MSVNVTKVEKTNTDYIWLNPKCSYNGQSAAKFSYYNTKLIYCDMEKGSTTIPVKGSRTQAIGVRSGARPKMDEDIVCSLLKNRG